jgi:3-oxoacyl-[acyl-carrier-protein] synthase II
MALLRDQPTSLPPRVVVTGIGLRTALGLSAAETWTALCRGRHGFVTLDLPHADGTPAYAGAPLAREAGRCPGDASSALVAAALEACDDPRRRAGAHPPDPDRAGVVIGMSKGDLGLLGRLHQGWTSRAAGFDDRMANWDRAWPDAAARRVARSRGLRGPCLAPVAACATGLVAALQGADLIRRGRCDFVLVGAGDAALEPLVLGAFRRMGVLARLDPGADPGRAVRPWDRRRSGFLVGEGAAVLALERAECARARGATPYAELAGGARGADAYHLAEVNPDPSALAHVITQALVAAGVPPEAIDHVNVHGTATRGNDPLECRALRAALGPQAERVSCSANKAQIGHLLGAAGAAELAITCLAVHHGFVPPTLNLTQPDPECDLDGTPLEGRPRTLRAALKLSIGFGGHLAAAVVKPWREEPLSPL